MPQRPIAELPKGYTILRVNERHYPLTLHSSERDEPITQAFINMRDGRAVSYSKRVYAANFIKDYISGNVPWAMLDGKEAQRDASPEAYRAFLDSTVDDAEYNAYLDHIHTPTADNY